VSRRPRCPRLEGPSTRLLVIFAPRRTSHLSHRDEPGGGPLNAACYMWWDILPLGGTRDDPAKRRLGRAALDVMTETLALDALACQKRALHGLGHWHAACPQEVEPAIDRFVHPTTDPRCMGMGFRTEPDMDPRAIMRGLKEKFPG